MAGERRSIVRGDLVKVFVRSLLIQASWSFERMQSLGFAFAMLPALRKLYPDRAEFEVRLAAHQAYFNTQPYLAAFIIGAAVRLEEERAAGRASDADIIAMKESLMAPLGALGDSFFWGALKPMAAALAAAVLIAGAWWAPLLYLVVYNLWHISLRAGVLFLGYRSAGDSQAFIARYDFAGMARLFKGLSLSILGGIAGMVTLWRPELRPSFSLPGPLLTAGVLAAVVGTVALMRKGGSPLGLMLALAAGCVAAAFFGVMR